MAVKELCWMIELGGARKWPVPKAVAIGRIAVRVEECLNVRQTSEGDR